MARLDPAEGSELRKTRPCVVVSPDEMNQHLRTVLVVPMTSARKGYPSRVESQFGGHPGEIAMDQLRCLDQRRLIRQLGTLDEPTQALVLATLQKMFS